MDNFINLNEEQESIIIQNQKSPIPSIKLDTKIVNGKTSKEEINECLNDNAIIQIEPLKSRKLEDDSEEQICIKEDCDISKYYGCPSESNGFQKNNLFSELTDEYQRTIARINLGIADSYALKWGNITGNLLNQKDLYTFVTDQIAADLNKVVEEINSKLAQWIYEVEVRLNNKADIYSPNFTGQPTTTLPLVTDNSSRIASTEWVNAKLDSLSINGNIKFMTMSPEYVYQDEIPVNVVVEWEYNDSITEQYINNNPLDVSIRQYTFTNIKDSFSIILKYKYNDKEYAQVLTFQVKCPIFYGTSNDYSKCKRTIENKMIVDAGSDQYIYIMIPNGKDSELGVNNIIGGFILAEIRELFNVIYYIYKSANYGLGETIVKIFD